MASFSSTFLSLALLFILLGASNAQLTTNYYSSACPQLFPTVKSVIAYAVKKEARMGASILRLFFHDCFVNGCDGSLLLDDTPTFTGEKMAKPNNGSVRGFEVIDQIKSAIEKVCPGVVSCADILAIAARDGIVSLGGPNWEVKLGRRDSRIASIRKANKDIPKPSSSLSTLVSKFANKGLSAKDMVALSGAHTIGMARCVNFRSHIYNDSNIDGSFANLRKSVCPKKSGSGDTNLAPLDLQTPASFDNDYFKNLMSNKGLLHSDQELFNGGFADCLVKSYSGNSMAFFSDFVTAMIKMGDISPLTGNNGEIRKNCRVVN
ncbi:hypothetical protein LUZ60_015415 [Juncus effusus]|nr:hypothetical protein LUZ60_015415 [Juncus effusus]